MADVRQFYELQELDWKFASVKKSLAEVRAKLADHSVLTSARERVEKLQTCLEELDSKRRASERTMTDLQEKLQRVESRLYGGAITSSRELAAAEEERGFTVQQHRENEDKFLDLMVEIEDGQVAQMEAQETLARLEVERTAEEAGVREKEGCLSSKSTSLLQRRGGLTSLLPVDWLTLYESLLKSKGGYAVALVERGMCQGCRLALSTMELQRARSAQGIVQCSSCGRILNIV